MFNAFCWYLNVIGSAHMAAARCIRLRLPCSAGVRGRTRPRRAISAG